MRVVLLAMGSRGDVEPLLALGLGLAGAGHRVSVTVPRDLLHLPAVWGLAAEPFEIDIVTASREGAGLRWQSEASKGLGGEYRMIRELGRTLADPVAEGVLRTAVDADVVVSGALTYDAAGAVCAHRGIRHVLALLAPVSPTRLGSSTVFAALPARSSLLNVASSSLSAVAAYRIYGPAGQVVRRRLGLPPGTLRDYWRTAYATPALLAASPELVPPAPEWGRRLRQVGSWQLPAPPEWEQSPELTDFLASGPPPVYVGFGSMMSRDPRATTLVVLEALRRAGARGLVSSGWTGLHAEDLPDEVRLVGEVPHAWLLPQVAAAVHHGGAGTTGAAARAGVPQLVVSHVGDQPYWGRRVAALGIGPDPIPRHRLDEVSLSAALRRMLDDPGMADRAADLGARVGAEDGATRAVELLERLPR